MFTIRQTDKPTHSKLITPQDPLHGQMPLRSQKDDLVVATQGEIVTLFPFLQSMHRVHLQHGR